MTELAVILALVLLNGVFAGAEIALLSLRETRLRELLAEGRPGARSVAALRAAPERLLATVQVGITVIGAAAGAFGGASFVEDVRPWLTPWLGAERAEVVAFIVVVGVVSSLSIVLGELVPKSLALRSAEAYALLVGPAIAAVAWAARPVVWALTTASNVLLRVFGDSTSFVESRLSAAELQQLVGEAATAGTVDAEAGAIAARAIAFSELTLNDVLVPRHQLASLPRTARAGELAALLTDRDHARVLVTGADGDDFVGVVKARHVLAAAARDGDAHVVDHLLPLTVVPLTMPASTLLRTLQAERAQLALVIDELGIVRGLVSLEDLVEELIGDVMSERERPRAGLRRDGDGWWVDASCPVRDVARALGADLPEPEDGTTIGGLVNERAGRIPAVGAEVDLGPFRAVVLEATRRRVLAVRLTPA